MLNGFPGRFSYLALKEKPRRPTNSFKSFTCLPYFHDATDKIQHVLNDVGVRVAMRPFVTVGKPLPSPKDPLDQWFLTRVDKVVSGVWLMLSDIWTYYK